MNIFRRREAARVLVAPLDWGLGHATRCIPLIRKLLEKDAAVWLAGNGASAQLLKTEFPAVSFLEMPGYEIVYGKNRWHSFQKLITQLPHLKRTIAAEKNWLKKAHAEHQFDAVISDNRYGLKIEGLHAVFITHQLAVQSPLPGTGWFINNILKRYIKHFDACWVPDQAGTPNLAAGLSHPTNFPTIPVQYIGALSRFSLQAPLLEHYILILLSGPEPQRTLLEQQLLQQAKLFQKPMLFVRGLPGATQLPKVPPHITIINHLPAPTLEKAVASAKLVIARCGYSTVMDLMTLQKRSILVPTPMQTEQEYLAKHLTKQQFVLALPQRAFNLQKALAQSEQFPYRFPVLEESMALDMAIDNLLQTVRKPATSPQPGMGS